MSGPTHNNRSVKEYNKIIKYKNLEIEIEKMLHLKTTTVPVRMGDLGMIKKGQINTFIKYLAVQRKTQKSVFCGTAYHLRRII